MLEVQKTEEFDEWLSGLADQRAQAKIVSRVERLGFGNPGDVKAVGEGVTGKTVVLLLCGGDKSTQDKDINRAKEIAAEL